MGLVVENTQELVIQRVPEEEKGQYLEDFLDDAASLIRRGQYKQAVNFLRNPTVAKTLGFDFDEDSRAFLVPQKIDKETVKTLAANVAMNSSFTYGPEKTGEIKAATVYVPPGKTRAETRNIPSELWHEVSLVHMEEWLHGLQHLKGRLLTNADDRERDIAEYLLQKNVPMTENFLTKHR